MAELTNLDHRKISFLFVKYLSNTRIYFKEWENVRITIEDSKISLFEREETSRILILLLINHFNTY